MKVKVDGQNLYDAMVARLERMQPTMDNLNQQHQEYIKYLKLKNKTPWFKRFLIWKYAVADPFEAGTHNWSNVFYRIRYEELESAIRNMKTDESYFIDSLEFDKYGLK